MYRETLCVYGFQFTRNCEKGGEEGEEGGVLVLVGVGEEEVGEEGGGRRWESGRNIGPSEKGSIVEGLLVIYTRSWPLPRSQDKIETFFFRERNVP